MFKMGGCIVLVLLCMTRVAFGLDLELTQGMNAALPIGIDSFGNQPAAQKLVEVIKQDLGRSGQFKLIEAVPGSSPTIWRAAGADNLVTGHVAMMNGQYMVHMSLIDAVSGGKILLARDFKSSERELRSLAHFMSDLIYEKLTGIKGIFSTRIAYVLVNEQRGHRRYSLEIADADGFNPQSVLVSSEPIMSPTWSPNGRQMACVSFENRRAQIFMIDVATGQRRLVSSFPGINGAPTWSPDGRFMALVLSRSGTPKIYQLDLSSGAMKQLTFGLGIDTEPRYAPDGRSLLFTSGRGGGPQIYRLNLQDGQIKRLTYDGTYNARASFTPNQAKIVMLHREDRRFMIAVQDLVTHRLMILSDQGRALDESPAIAPNGRLVIYATQAQDRGILEIVSIDGHVHMRLPSKEGDVQEPAWSPYMS